jgi:hypothetical protein
MLYKAPFPLDRHLGGICPPFCLGSYRGEGSLIADWLGPVVAFVTPILRLCRSCRGQPTFGKTTIGGLLSSSPALALLGGVASRLLAQPALWAEPVFSPKSHGDSWDASRQIARPVACPISHPHDTSPRNWRSLMG